MNTPEISVIVCSYNHAKWIERCLRSLSHQEHLSDDEYEIIVVEDSSSDQTRYILEKLPKHKNLRVINNSKNLGLPASLNIGLKESRGRYVVRVDSDDYVARSFLYFLKTFLNYNKEYQAVAIDYLVVDENEVVLKKENGLQTEIACGVMFRKECLFDIGLYNEEFKMREGHELRRRFQSKFVIGRLEFPLYRYRKHSDNRTLNLDNLSKYDEMLLGKISEVKE